MTDTSATVLIAQSLEHWRKNPIEFIETVLFDPETGKPYRLLSAEREFLQHAFTFTSDGRLVFHEWLYSRPKKSGKTTFEALVIIAMLLLYGGAYPEAYICANSLEQGKGRVFEMCCRIIRASPLLKDEAVITSDKITFPAFNAVIQVISSNAGSAAGTNAVIAGFDELWGYKDENARRVWDELTPPPTRKVACRMTVTYAGFEDQSQLLLELYRRGKQQPLVGDSLYAGDYLLMAWHHKPVAPWQDEAWLTEMKRQRTSLYQRHVLNEFAPSSSAQFVTAEQYDPCVTLPAPPRCHSHMPVMIGLDIGVRRDSTAIVVVNGENLVVNGKKENGVRVDDIKIFVPAPGKPVDLEQVEQVLIDYKKKYPNLTIIYDPREMELMSARLKHLGIKTEEFPQTPSALSALTQNLHDLICYQRLQVYPHDQLRKSILNCVIEEKSTGLRLIRRSQANAHVDVVIALGMAALRCVERHTSAVDWAYKYRAFDPNFRDEDLPPPDPNRQPSAAQSTLVDGYRAVAAAFGAPLHDRKAPIPKPLPPDNRSADANWWKRRS